VVCVLINAGVLRTLIRHAAISGAISAAALDMHLPPSVTRLVSTAGFALFASPCLESAIGTAITLASIASSANNDLSPAA
jgi:hypothetical protein